MRTGHFRQNVCEEAWGWIREIDKLSFWGNRGDTNEVKASLRCFRLFLRSPSATTSVWVSGCSSCLHSQLWYECPTPTSAGTPAQTLGQLKSKSGHSELSCAWFIGQLFTKNRSVDVDLQNDENLFFCNEKVSEHQNSEFHFGFNVGYITLTCSSPPVPLRAPQPGLSIRGVIWCLASETVFVKLNQWK